MRKSTKFIAVVFLFFIPMAIFGEPETFTNRLPIPPLAENVSEDPSVVRFELAADKSTFSFLPDLDTQTFGFNGPYLGPTIRVKRGQRVEIAVTNNIGETTTVHWHGLHIPGEMDGGPHQTIEPGGTWTPEFDIVQQAATLWYHPHQLGKTGEHVYMGLAGLFIIDDDHSEALGLPDRYGVDDIPLIIQDKRFYENGEFAYASSMDDFIHGVIGDYILVNGSFEPYVEVGRGLVRFRLLNASDSTIHRYRLADESSFLLIATDGGFLEKPFETDNLILSPGERAEILIDFSSSSPDDELYLDVDTYTGSSYHSVKIVTTDTIAAEGRVPETLNSIPPIPESDAVTTRIFRMETRGMGRFSINGRTMDMERIDARIPLDSTEIWEIRNVGMGMMNIPHSFHVHDVQFQILDINGEAPPPQLAGWKDTVLVWPGDRVRIIARYTEFTGIYMFHCHLLVHEDEGMMGQFEVF